MTDIYRAKPVTQRDGSPLQNSNCLMAACATGLDFDTLGKKTSTGSKMRQLSGDTVAGTTTDDIQTAWSKGYDEKVKDRDGQPWDKVLEDLWGGRLVMLQVWHATTGGPCLSGAGRYGHGLAVAPEQRTASDGSREWLVSDPWCKPARWKWWPQSKLKAGAEQWYQMVLAEAGGPGRTLLRLAAQRLFSRYDPHRPAEKEPPEAGGPAGCLFASSDAHPATQEAAAGDVSINIVDGVASPKRVTTKPSIPFYGDAARQNKLGTLGSASKERVFIGTPVGSGSRAIIVNTSTPYDDGVDRDTIVYVKASDASDPHDPK